MEVLWRVTQFALSRPNFARKLEKTLVKVSRNDFLVVHPCARILF
jgi:hypothetical protein